jgi:hypothetical protein
VVMNMGLVLLFGHYRDRITSIRGGIDSPDWLNTTGHTPSGHHYVGPG